MECLPLIDKIKEEAVDQEIKQEEESFELIEEESEVSDETKVESCQVEEDRLDAEREEICKTPEFTFVKVEQCWDESEEQEHDSLIALPAEKIKLEPQFIEEEQITTTDSESTSHHGVGGVEESKKKKWASIRDQFQRVLQKRKTSSGQAAARPHKHKFKDVLSFLTPSLMERETLSNVSTFQEEKEQGKETIAEESSLGEPTVDVEESSIEESLIEEPTSKNSAMAKISTQGQFLKPNAKKRKISSRHQQDSPANQLMAYFVAEKKAEAARIATKEPAMHAVDAFLTGIALTLKSLSPILLNQAKTEIFSTVQEFELKQLESDLACQE